MKRDTRSAYRARQKAAQSTIDNAVAELKAERQAEWDAAKARAREAEANRTHYTAADLKDARFVRTRLGWHEVVRINGKSVTVATPYSWTDRIAVDKILEHKS